MLSIPANYILGLLMPGINKVIDKLIPDSNARAQAQEEITRALIDKEADVEKAIAEAAKAQAEVNLKEAESPSLFIAGWRPAVGWMCVFGLGYQYILWPFLDWGTSLAAVASPPTLSTGELMPLILGMLGLGGMRSFEKAKGIDRQSMRKVPKR